MPLSPFPRPHCSSASTWATSRRTSIAPRDGSGGREKGRAPSASSPRCGAPGSRRPAPGLCRTTPGVPPRTADPGGELNTAIAVPFRNGSAGESANTMYVINATGVLTGEYRKGAPFHPLRPRTRCSAGGTSARSVPTDAGLIGPLICYDLRFPELSRKYFLEGATILCVAAQWPSVRSSHWDILTTARAVENQAYLVAANAVGPSGPFRYSGGSVVVSPPRRTPGVAGGGRRDMRWRRSIRPPSW